MKGAGSVPQCVPGPLTVSEPCLTRRAMSAFQAALSPVTRRQTPRWGSLIPEEPLVQPSADSGHPGLPRDDPLGEALVARWPCAGDRQADVPHRHRLRRVRHDVVEVGHALGHDLRDLGVDRVDEPVTLDHDGRPDPRHDDPAVPVPDAGRVIEDLPDLAPEALEVLHRVGGRLGDDGVAGLPRAPRRARLRAPRP